MANVKIYKCLTLIFALALTISDVKLKKKLNFRKYVTVSDNAILANFAIAPIHGKCQYLQMSPIHFAIALTASETFEKLDGETRYGCGHVSW